MSEARSFLFPYCIIQLADGRYIVVNRYYKPLGNKTSDWIKYEDDPSVIALKITPAIAKKLSWAQSEATDRIYLYADGCIPTDGAVHMKSYLQRLAVLMAVKLKT